jgi:hypothetical protein
MMQRARGLLTVCGTIQVPVVWLFRRSTVFEVFSRPSSCINYYQHGLRACMPTRLHRLLLPLLPQWLQLPPTGCNTAAAASTAYRCSAAATTATAT